MITPKIEWIGQEMVSKKTSYIITITGIFISRTKAWCLEYVSDNGADSDTVDWILSQYNFIKGEQK